MLRNVHNIKKLKRVIIVVPLYKNWFDQFEKLAWEQLSRVLGKYPICLVVPQKYHQFYAANFSYRIESFSDYYFTSTKTYSQLLLSDNFYQCFKDYEYLLIYQLDAFIFSDKLNYFISLDYDYIGAPLPRWSNYWYSMKTRPGKAYIPFLGRVGNGGFSLRKVDAMLRILQRKDEILATHPLSRLFQEQEDMFFAYCGTLTDGLNIPDVRIARQFSVEMDVGYCYRNLADCLPFGCHAWYKIAFHIWKKFILSEEYQIETSNIGKDFKSFRRIVLSFYLMERMLRKVNRDRALLVASSILVENSYAIWGVGTYGKLLLCWLRNAGIQVDCGFDGRANYPMEYYNVPVLKPKDSLVKKYRGRLIVSTIDYKDDIICELGKNGFQKNDFITMEEFINLLLNTYFKYQ